MIAPVTIILRVGNIVLLLDDFYILLPFQKAILEAIFAVKIYNDELGRYVRKYQEVLLVMGRKNGKALAIDTPIPTPEGWRTMGELNVGDKVFSVDGSISEVVTVSPARFGHQCYKVTFEDGEEITADAEHLWTVKVKKHHSRKTVPISLTLSDPLSVDRKSVV